MALNRAYEVFKESFADGNVESPLQFKYIDRVQILMSAVGSWPYKEFGRHQLDYVLSMFNLLIVIIFISLVILGTVYIRFHWEKMTFFDLGHSVLCLMLTTLALQRFMTARSKKYKETIREYLLEFHLFYFKGRSSYAAKVYAQIQIISGVFTLFVIWLMFTGVTLFLIMPWYNNYSRGMFGEHRPANSTFEHALYYQLPEAVYTTIQGYWIFFAINIPLSAIDTIGLCTFDLLLSLIVFQIWGHLTILKHNLLSIPLPDGESGMYSIEENIHIKMLLKENILHHSFIIKFVDRCSDAFSEYLFGFYFLMQVITCVLLLEVTTFTAESFCKYGPLTIGMYQQLIQVSILFEMINTKSEQLIDALYSIPWESMDTTNKRIVLIFLQRIQTPVSLKAAKVVPVGVNTMTAVLKTTFSYYMVLNAIAGER